MAMFKKPEDVELNQKVEAQLEKLDKLTKEIDEQAEEMALFEAQLIKYMIENQVSELTVGDMVVSLNLDEALDIEKMKEDGIYDKYTEEIL